MYNVSVVTKFQLHILRHCDGIRPDSVLVFTKFQLHILRHCDGIRPDKYVLPMQQLVWL